MPEPAPSGEIQAQDGLDVWRPPGLERWPWLRAAVSTRRGGTSLPPFDSLNLGLSSGDRPEHVHENRARFRRSLGVDGMPLVALHQVHGTRILEAPGVESGTEGDGLWTRAPGTALAVGVADCVPLFVWDARRRWVGVVHAGWRGTQAGILGVALDAWSAAGSNPADTWVALGPSIGPCCYSVSAEVAAGFPSEVVRGVDGEPHLDLRHANRLLALGRGVPSRQVLHEVPCTSCSTEIFFSYRREKGHTGRMWAVVWRDA
jgi:hypothetical protein